MTPRPSEPTTLRLAHLSQRSPRLPAPDPTGDRPRAARLPMERPADQARHHERRAREIAPDRRRDVRQRVLDEQTAGRTQPPRSLVSRVLQAAAAAVFHRSVHGARRHRLRPVHGPRHDRHRSGTCRTNAGRMRYQSVERDTRTAASVAADGRRGRGEARWTGSVDRCRHIRRNSRSSIIPKHSAEICALREYLLARDRRGTIDGIDRWIRMVAVNRLTGHSPGFFSVYTLPPNQAASAESQAKINARRKQAPPRRDVRALIAAKTRSLLPTATARRARRCCGRRSAPRC